MPSRSNLTIPLTATVALVAAALVATGLMSSAPAGAAVVGTTGHITVEQFDEEPDGCLPGFLVLSRVVINTAAEFGLDITASEAPCDPINASAVIYAMPPETWPQTLSEKVDFTITKPGLTKVRFEKDCDDVQYDVVTGATPEVISPAEPHGPMLFPLDLDTALQYWGENYCNPTTTTTTTTTTSTTSSTVPGSSTTSTTSSTTPQVQGSTTVVTTTTIKPTVAGQSATNTNPTAISFTG